MKTKFSKEIVDIIEEAIFRGATVEVKIEHGNIVVVEQGKRRILYKGNEY